MAKLTKKQNDRMVGDMLKGIYHPTGYPRYSPLLFKSFRRIMKTIKDEVALAEKLYG